MPRPTTKVDKTRLNLDLSAPIRQCLEQLRERTGAESLTEVIRRAIVLYDTIITISLDKKTQLILKYADGSERQVLVT
jgi:hypothetical protein